MKLPLALEVRSGDSLAMDQGATAPALVVAVIDGDGDYLDVGEMTVRFRIDGRQADGRIRTTGDEIEYRWDAADTAEPGEYPCQFELRPGGGDVLKAPSYRPANLTVHRSV